MVEHFEVARYRASGIAGNVGREEHISVELLCERLNKFSFQWLFSS